MEATLKECFNAICLSKMVNAGRFKSCETYQPASAYDGMDAVKEARDRGVSIEQWFDSQDQTVLDISHLGCCYKNIWAKGSWGPSDTYVRKAIKKMNEGEDGYRKAVHSLISCGIVMSQKTRVQVMFTDGCGKGYLTLLCFDLSPSDNVEDYMKHIDGNNIYEYMVSINVNCYHCHLHNYMLDSTQSPSVYGIA